MFRISLRDESDSVPSEAIPADREVVDALLQGDEAAFLALVQLHHRSMIRVARCYVSSDAVAEDVVQDTWMVILRSLYQWEGRGSLKSWIFGIVANQARSRARAESKTVPFSAVASPGEDPDRVLDGPPNSAEEHSDWSGALRSSDGWGPDRLESRELLDTIQTAIATLPPMQRAIITMRDVAGCDGSEACAALCVSESNQRVLLHRARVKVRAAVDAYLCAA